MIITNCMLLLLFTITKDFLSQATDKTLNKCYNHYDNDTEISELTNSERMSNYEHRNTMLWYRGLNIIMVFFTQAKAPGP